MKTIEVFVLSFYGDFIPIKLTVDKTEAEKWSGTSSGHVESFIVTLPQEIQVQADY